MDRFNSILNKTFGSSQKAIAYCQDLARLCGFSVRIRTSKTTTIYIVCSREGLPEPNHQKTKKRSRNSERCSCNWRIVLYRRNPTQWEFRSGKSMEHNHIIYSSEAFLEAQNKMPSIASLLEMPHQSSSPLPSIYSLDLPLPDQSELSSPSFSASQPRPGSTSNSRLISSAYQERSLNRPVPYTHPQSLSFLLN
ncbi:hypothetical protein DSO57_1023329 [Entomophthora muscae]|uniref:Uncharacterized protein n=1 Tax=Entomophthora muscae TaxID=34485 RepID=A0ACC2UDE4_9FUNG|nr:hypothetical protein DSO57_1023329 [Entomophthora muscae]